MAGRSAWPSRDPITEDGFITIGVYSKVPDSLDEVNNLYLMVLNDAQNKIDILGNLSYKTTLFGGPHFNNGGDYFWTIKWGLGTYDITGYIVQKVEIKQAAFSCGLNTNVKGYPFSFTYFEAFEVNNHSVGNDSWGWSGVHGCTYGNASVVGTAAFFAIGKLPPIFTAGGATDSNGNNWALGLPATTKTPWFWGKTGRWVSNYIVRSLTVQWNSCGWWRSVTGSAN